MSEIRPRLKNGLIVDDCVPLSEERRAAQARAVAGAVSINEYQWREDDDPPPVIKWDGYFEELIEKRIHLIDRITARGGCLLPWRILEALPDSRVKSRALNWYQGPNPSCAGHGGTHAAQDATLIDIALGAPRAYDALNPIYPYYIKRGENMFGGLNLYDLAEQMNEGGQYPVSVVGDDNISAPRNWRKFSDTAKKYQCAIIFIENDFVNKIFRACHAGFPVAFASNTIWDRSTTDENGIKVMRAWTSGGHAQEKSCYRIVNGTEYVFNRNSHGRIYGKSAEGEPEEGAWNTRAHVEREAETMAPYGFPFITLNENPAVVDAGIINDFKVEFPANWKG